MANVWEQCLKKAVPWRKKAVEQRDGMRMLSREWWLSLSPSTRSRAVADQAIRFLVKKKQKEPVKKRYLTKRVV